VLSKQYLMLPFELIQSSIKK